MYIDLAALPDDVETLQRMVRTLAAERANLAEAQAEVERLGSSSRSYSAVNLVGAPNGSMTISYMSARPFLSVRKKPKPTKAPTAAARAASATYRISAVTVLWRHRRLPPLSQSRHCYYSAPNPDRSRTKVDIAVDSKSLSSARTDLDPELEKALANGYWWSAR